MNEVITSIRKASIELSKWFGYATAMIDKINVEKICAPQSHNLCKFGQWYKEDQWNLSAFSEYAQIGEHHIKLHELFDKLMFIVNKEQKPSFFKKLTGAPLELPKSDRKILLTKYQEFKDESKSILSLLKVLQKNVEQNGVSSQNQKAA